MHVESLSPLRAASCHRHPLLPCLGSLAFSSISTFRGMPGNLPGKCFLSLSRSCVLKVFVFNTLGRKCGSSPLLELNLGVIQSFPPSSLLPHSSLQWAPTPLLPQLGPGHLPLDRGDSGPPSWTCPGFCTLLSVHTPHSCHSECPDGPKEALLLNSWECCLVCAGFDLSLKPAACSLAQ